MTMAAGIRIRKIEDRVSALEAKIEKLEAELGDKKEQQPIRRGPGRPRKNHQYVEQANG